MEHPHQLDTQVLVDWLAKETQLYTKAMISGASNEIVDRHRLVVDAIIAEIRHRKREDLLPPQAVTGLPSN